MGLCDGPCQPCIKRRCCCLSTHPRSLPIQSSPTRVPLPRPLPLQEFLAATLSTHQIEKAENMRAAFAHFDTDNSGTISKEELRQALQVRGRCVDRRRALLGRGRAGHGVFIIAGHSHTTLLWLLVMPKLCTHRPHRLTDPSPPPPLPPALSPWATRWTQRLSASWRRRTRTATGRSTTTSLWRCGGLWAEACGVVAAGKCSPLPSRWSRVCGTGARVCGWAVPWLQPHFPVHLSPVHTCS